MVSAIDLELDDAVHIGTAGHKRLGTRLADVADGHVAPDIADVRVEVEGARIRVTYNEVRGGWCAPGRPAGFSVRDPDGREAPLIYKVTLDGDTAVLYLVAGTLPSGLDLWYGWGADPYCNVADAVDIAIPAAGPLPLTHHRIAPPKEDV